MASVMISATCNSCNRCYESIFVDRDTDGRPTLQGIVCSECGAKNCMTRNWGDQKVNVIATPAEDGNINRFEYSFTNDKGKKVTKKLDPQMVQKHFKNNYGKGN